MRSPTTPRPLSLARSAADRAGMWLTHVQARATSVLSRSRQGSDDQGATAIEWAIFALLAITIAGLVAGAIAAAVNNRLPGIQ